MALLVHHVDYFLYYTGGAENLPTLIVKWTGCQSFSTISGCCGIIIG